eukprot:1156347-Pelagomonas_calceolata.AAC.8
MQLLQAAHFNACPLLRYRWSARCSKWLSMHVQEPAPFRAKHGIRKVSRPGPWNYRSASQKPLKSFLSHFLSVHPYT